MTDMIPRAEADARVAAAMHPRVKPLVWEEGHGVSRAASPFGDYTVVNGVLTLPLPMRPQRVYESEEEAKAAAQSDNENRIIGALEPAPDDARAALKAMLAEAEKRGEKRGMLRAAEIAEGRVMGSSGRDHEAAEIAAAIRAARPFVTGTR